jgi:transposase
MPNYQCRCVRDGLELLRGVTANVDGTMTRRRFGVYGGNAAGRHVSASTIPGVNRLTSSTLIAELGVQMQQFPDAMHLASWAGLCPGNCESAGKRKNTRNRKGNPHVRRVLCQAPWAAAHTKRAYLAALFYRIASKGGRKKALIAVARHLIVIAFHLIRAPLTYRDLCANYLGTWAKSGLPQ